MSFSLTFKRLKGWTDVEHVFEILILTVSVPVMCVGVEAYIISLCAFALPLVWHQNDLVDNSCHSCLFLPQGRWRRKHLSGSTCYWLAWVLWTRQLSFVGPLHFCCSGLLGHLLWAVTTMVWLLFGASNSRAVPLKPSPSICITFAITCT